ncbi:MAG: DUF3224 domain-containing protein [Solirubrobacterales bacterium]
MAIGTFEVELTPVEGELDGAVARIDLAKDFYGDLDGAGRGLMLSAGDPGSGSAGYVAIETFAGNLAGREGSFALQQFGTMHGGTQTLRYEVVPGSGRDGLEGITGALELTIEDDGTHRYALEYEL